MAHQHCGERRLLLYENRRGVRPFEAWLGTIQDRRAKARIFARIDRLRFGNLGDFRAVGGGVLELRIDQGPGYRVYFSIVAANAVLLLGGGSKGTQRRDIAAARRAWQEYERHAHA